MLPSRLIRLLLQLQVKWVTNTLEWKKGRAFDKWSIRGQTPKSFDCLTCTPRFTDLSLEFTLQMVMLKPSVFDGKRSGSLKEVIVQLENRLIFIALNLAVTVPSHAWMSRAVACTPQQCNATAAPSSAYFRQFGEVRLEKTLLVWQFTCTLLQPCQFALRWDMLIVSQVFSTLLNSEIQLLGVETVVKNIGRMYLFSNPTGFLIVRFERRKPKFSLESCDVSQDEDFARNPSDFDKKSSASLHVQAKHFRWSFLPFWRFQVRTNRELLVRWKVSVAEFEPRTAFAHLVTLGPCN